MELELIVQWRKTFERYGSRSWHFTISTISEIDKEIDKDNNHDSEEEFTLTDDELRKSIMKLRTLHGKEHTIRNFISSIRQSWYIDIFMICCLSSKKYHL